MENTTKRKQLLRTAYPKLYIRLMDELAKHNIHAYDVRAASKTEDNTVEIYVQFGEAYQQELTKVIQKQEELQDNSDFLDFCKKVGETCKETMIADYFRMVKP